MNERTSIVPLCYLLKEALWKDNMGRISTMFVCLCALILCFYVFFPSGLPSLQNSVRITMCTMLDLFGHFRKIANNFT